MAKILFLVNQDGTLFNFRRELVFELLDKGHEIYINSPYGKKLEPFLERGAHHIDLKIDRRGVNLFKEAKVVMDYIRILHQVKPDIVLTYTSKCSVYGGLVCTIKRVPYIVNNCGLFDPDRFGWWMDVLLNILYKLTYSKTACLMCQNKVERDFLNSKVAGHPHFRLLPGSGVNLERFQPMAYPEDGVLKFCIICRIQKEKGIEEYLSAAKYIKLKYPNTEFHIIGGYDEDYQMKVEAAQAKGYVIYHGAVADVRPYLKEMHCLINPSYHEGMSNVILESNALGRPAIASDCMGCNDIVSDGYNGFLAKVADANNLAKQIERFILLSHEERKVMGENARKRVEAQFDRNIVTKAYIDEINDIISRKKMK